MVDDLIFRVGETRKVTHTVRASTTPRGLAGAVYDAQGVPVATAPVSVAACADTEGLYDLSFAWGTAGCEPGDYVTGLTYAADGETCVVRGEVTLLPLTSRFDRYVRRVAGWLLETARPEDRELSWRQGRELVTAAIREYEVAVPRMAATVVTLSGGVWEYALPEGWRTGVSTILAAEYPLEEGSQSKWWLPSDGWVVDEARGVWRFRSWVPRAGQQARLYWWAGRAVDETQDTVDEADFESVTQYAAGLGLLALANVSPRRNAPPIGADVAVARTKEQEYGARAKEMLAQARAAWEQRAKRFRGLPEDAPSLTATWEYCSDREW